MPHQVDAKVVEVHVPMDIKDIFTVKGLTIWTDYLFFEFFGIRVTNYDHEKQKSKYEDDAEFKHNQATPSFFDPFSHPGGHNTPRVGSLYTMYKN